MQIKHIFSIGLNDQTTKKQIYTQKQAQNRIISTLTNHNISGYTITSAKGGYRHTDNTFINENSLILELFDKLPRKVVKQIINDLKAPECLNQESIAYTKQKVHTMFM
jgi:uncharacterized membrane-anchored protein YitT (DUF2179 family)